MPQIPLAVYTSILRKLKKGDDTILRGCVERSTWDACCYAQAGTHVRCLRRAEASFLPAERANVEAALKRRSRISKDASYRSLRQISQRFALVSQRSEGDSGCHVTPFACALTVFGAGQ